MYSFQALLNWSIFEFTLCLFLFSVAFGSLSPGETTPSLLEIATGGSANITCYMTMQKIPGKDNESLYFVVEDTDERVAADDVVVLNETASVLMLRNAPAQNRNYVCRSGQYAIATTHVSVGTAPVNVSDFECRGYDYEYIACNFTEPSNMLLSEYKLIYTVNTGPYFQQCNLIRQKSQRVCNLTLDDGNYRRNYEYYNFTLTGQNALGTNTQTFLVNHFDSVVPPRLHCSFEQITTDSALLTWSLKRYMFYAEKGLQYWVQLQPVGMDWRNYTDFADIRRNRSEFKMHLRQLPYAYYPYRISVRVKVKTARDDAAASMWSEPAESVFQTSACIPAMPPATDIGSFYINAMGDRVRLYWEQLPVYRENGPNFRYAVTRVKRDNVLVAFEPKHIDRISATFEWDKRHQYEFELKSRNAEGDSPMSSRIVVPSMADGEQIVQRNPKWIRNVYHKLNRTYTLSWSEPTDADGLIDYTVFWCNGKRETRNECQDTIHFQHVSRHTLHFNTVPQPQRQEQTLILAVSANYLNVNTGMHWIMCTADEDSELGMIDPEFRETQAHSVLVQWSIECVYMTVLDGYNLTYCRLPFNDATAPCLETNVTLVEKNAKSIQLTELRPYSTYRIEMYMYSKQKGKGKVSDEKTITTLEAAPAHPRNLKLHNITSNMAWIVWMPPSQLNGQLRYYTVVYNREREIVNCSRLSTFLGAGGDNSCGDSESAVAYRLENLRSYTDYKVYVIAHTVEASNDPSNDIHFKTLIDRPSNPHKIVFYENNQTLVWQPPEMPSGLVEFNEVLFIVGYKRSEKRRRISGVVGSTSCIVRIPTCVDAGYHYTLKVRAVNVVKLDHEVFAANGTSGATKEADDDEAYYAGNDDLSCVGTALTDAEQAALLALYRDPSAYVQYKSVWQNGPVYNCAETRPASSVSVLAILGMMVALGIICAYYPVRNYVNKMSDIKVVLPTDLASVLANSTGGDSGGFESGDKQVLYSPYQPLCISSGSVGTSSTLPDIVAVPLSHQAVLPAAGAVAVVATSTGNADEVATVAHEEGGLESPRLISSGYNIETGHPLNSMTPSSLGKSCDLAGSNNFDDYVGSDVCAASAVADHDDYMVIQVPQKADASVAVPTYVSTAAAAARSESPPSTEDGASVWERGLSMASMYAKNNNYINRNKMFGWQQPSPQLTGKLNQTAEGDAGGGYVPLHALQKFPMPDESVPTGVGVGDFDGDGYTKWDALAKGAVPLTQQQTSKSIASQSLAGDDMTSGCAVKPHISGYVT